MSIESAKAFYERMLTDEAFQTYYQNATTNDERRDVVLSAGYNFTPEEWEAAITQISESSEGELSDAELTSVSGGILPGGCLPGWPPKDPPIYPMYGLPVD